MLKLAKKCSKEFIRRILYGIQTITIIINITVARNKKVRLELDSIIPVFIEATS